MARIIESIRKLEEFEKPREKSISEKNFQELQRRKSVLAGRLPNPMELIFSPSSAMERYRLVDEASKEIENEFEESLPKSSSPMDIGGDILRESLGKIPESSDYLRTQEPIEEEVKKSEKSLFDQLNDDFMKNLPQFPSETYEAASKNAGKVSRTIAEKESKASKLGAERLEEFQNVIGNQINLQNAIYTDWLQNSKQAQKDIDTVQSKYPNLTRADILANMSVGEKITTSVLTALGAVFSGKGEENPALKILNRNLDESILQQSLNYDRQMKNIMTKKVIDDDTFRASLDQAKSNFEMQNNNLQTALKIIDLSRAERTSDELQDIENKAKFDIDLQVANSKMNYDLQVFSLGQQQKMFMAKMALEQGKRSIPVQFGRMNSEGGVNLSKTTLVLLNAGKDRDKFQLEYSDRMAKIRSLQDITKVANSNPSKNELNTLIESHNVKFKDKIKEAGYFMSDVREATEELKTFLSNEIAGLNEFIDQSIVNYSE